MGLLSSLLNPVKWAKAWQYARKSARFDKSSYDLELFLYSRILKSGMLHYGYFENVEIEPDTMSLRQLEDAQILYAERIIAQIQDQQRPVLDVGCGIGGLSAMMHDRGLTVESLTPNKNQIEYINQHYAYLPTHCCKYEQFVSECRFGTVINSESLQYIALNDAFDQTDRILLQGGRWIIVDYFRVNDTGINKSAHLLDTFLQQVQQAGWQIVYEENITRNVLPTIAYANMFAERFLLPIKHFAFEKLRYKQPALYFMTDVLRDNIERKFEKEKASIDPEKFLREKQYMCFVLERQPRA